MQNTTHFNLKTVEGTDLFNPLTQMNPNFEDIDTQMYNNQQNGICTATHNKSGTLHTIVRSIAGLSVFRFTAPGDYRTGDTFTVDGQSVNAVLPDGSSLPDYAFRINSNIIAIQAGGILTIVTNGASVDLSGLMETADYVGSSATGVVHKAELADTATEATNAANADKLGGNLPAYYAKASDVAPLIQNITAIQQVAALPTNPVATTLYLVTE